MKNRIIRRRLLKAAAIGTVLPAMFLSFLWLLPRTGLLVVAHGPRDLRQVSLTFDADMTRRMEEEYRSGKVGGWYDERIVTYLEEQRVPATFFITGLWAKNHPDVLKRLSQNPLFEIQNHSFSHPAFSSPCYGLPRNRGRRREILDAQETLRALTGKAPTLFRFPGGCYSVYDYAHVRLAGLEAVGWDVASMDSVLTEPDAIVAHVLESSRNGSIVIMHLSGPPNAPATAAALPPIVRGLRERGFSMVTVSHLLGREPQDPAARTVTRRSF